MTISDIDSADRPNNDLSKDEEVMRLLSLHHRTLYGYLKVLLNNTCDAEEVLQNTSVTLWRKRDQFVLGTSFTGWALTIAKYEVYRFRRKNKRSPQLLTDEILEQVALETASNFDLIETRFEALGECVRALNTRDRSLVGMVYRRNATSQKDISQRLGMSPDAFYTALSRIRRRLLKCIEHRLATEGIS